MENLVNATGRVNLRDSDSVELSSEDEDLIYTQDNNEKSYHSTAYSAYKKRIAKEFNSGTDEDSDSGNSNSEDSEEFSEGFD